MAPLTNNTSVNLSTAIPEEVLKHDVGFIEGPKRGAMSNAFGKISEHYASFQCYDCKRWQPLSVMEVDLWGLAVIEDDYRAVYHNFFCIDEAEWEEAQHPCRIMLGLERFILSY